MYCGPAALYVIDKSAQLTSQNLHWCIFSCTSGYLTLLSLLYPGTAVVIFPFFSLRFLFCRIFFFFFFLVDRSCLFSSHSLTFVNSDVKAHRLTDTELNRLTTEMNCTAQGIIAIIVITLNGI